jgi:copper chaperone CopZ|tara:strand:+ start:5388 stop:5759 length:372 start_codon:yes stop_codon:yes gene_type:complete
MKRTIDTIAVLSLLFGLGLVVIASTSKASTFEPDMEVKINGLVCSSCAIGIKKYFKKYTLQVDDVKFDTKKQLALVDFFKNENGGIYWLKNQEIIKLVENAGYKVKSIKRLTDNRKPNRYNKP